MLKKASLVFFTLMILFILLAGCGRDINSDAVPSPDFSSPTPTPQDSTAVPAPDVPNEIPVIEDPIKDSETIDADREIVNPEIFFTLSSPSLEGRIMGSPGSKKAQDILSDLFSRMKLRPLYQNYPGAVLYTRTHRGATSITMSLDGTFDSSLMAMQDYFVAPGAAFSGEYRVVYKAAPKDGEKVIFIIDEDTEKEIPSKREQAAGYIYLKSPLFKSGVNGASEHLKLFMSEEIINRLKYYDGKATLTLDIPASQNIETIEGNNIVGYLPGENSKECIVISAHYDGDDNQTAALDNAGGTYTLVKIAETLSKPDNARKLEKDIIIAALDGEEQGLIGSGYLAREIKKRYKKAEVINLDCVGIKDSDSYMVVGDSTRFGALVDSLYEQLKAFDFGTVSANSLYTSDHLSFEWQGIPAVTIGEKNVSGIIHTGNDTAQNVDTAELDRLAEVLCSYILK